MKLKLILTLFNLPHLKNRNIILNNKLQDNIESQNYNSTNFTKKNLKFQDCAIIPLKDIPKCNSIWNRRVY